MDRRIFSVFIMVIGALPLRASGDTSFQDTAYLRQQIFNGRVWEKRYSNVYGNEFFLTEALTEVSVKINGRVFNGQLCWYDIYNDQLVLMAGPGSYIEANKRNIEEFTMVYRDRTYRFVNFGTLGYGHVLHQGKLSLAVRYTKEIRKNAVENRYDAFGESQQVFIVRGDDIVKLSGKNDLFNAMSDKEPEVRHFMRQSGIRANFRRPETIIPVLQYYDSL